MKLGTTLVLGAGLFGSAAGAVTSPLPPAGDVTVIREMNPPQGPYTLVYRSATPVRDCAAIEKEMGTVWAPRAARVTNRGAMLIAENQDGASAISFYVKGPEGWSRAWHNAPGCHPGVPPAAPAASVAVIREIKPPQTSGVFALVYRTRTAIGDCPAIGKEMDSVWASHSRKATGPQAHVVAEDATGASATGFYSRGDSSRWRRVWLNCPRTGR